ncbi:MAG: collagenase [Spirochaetes bacterium GWD1_61_31]|nr:MAG: collagenase [Spirochaetes bacterium GWB1_60_80]OHD42290.1 MAG: collagenase [Spirochaetes bacterium GWD1_61_31]OHD43684.1 MAG: collagenase [Spirochaetes bacterium GWE1_60_18]HAP44478.1 collagenase-like protease [Spirochaetaceae bacterium]HAW86600.1 collagenase-like protease [Spirochaetaceae bacterium]
MNLEPSSLTSGRPDRGSIELLAPVGSLESLAAAIQGGADAVYFGAGRLNMRAKSTRGLGPDDIATVVRRSHQAGRRAYLTLNTILYDDDLPQLRALAAAAAAAGVDAVIASDIAALQYCRSLGLTVHASTQLNISNIEAVRFYAQWVDVAVLARELTLEQVSRIAAAIREQAIRGPGGQLVRLEIFVHGALCMAVSGKCYLSLHEYNLSANRGSCVQVCRRAYEVRDRDSDDVLAIDNEYIMSPKDLCTVQFLNKIIDAGVSVLKIEGRARAPEYVKTVCSVYDEALRALADGSYGQAAAPDSPVLAGWRQRLGSVFNRGFWDGYYLGQCLGEWSSVYGSASTIEKVYVGKVTNYYHQAGTIELLVENEPVAPGDQVMFLGPTTGVHELVLPGLQLDGVALAVAERGQSITFKVEGRIRRADKLYKLVERA